jgi:hypothetical protein
MGTQLHRAQYILLSVVFTPSFPAMLGSIWILPVISLLLTNTVSPVRACLSYDERGFVGPKKKTTVSHFRKEVRKKRITQLFVN